MLPIVAVNYKLLNDLFFVGGGLGHLLIVNILLVLLLVPNRQRNLFLVRRPKEIVGVTVNH